MNPIVPQYKFDVCVGLTLLAASADCATTLCFLTYHLGTEANPVLAPLAAQSLWWVPFYILSRPLLIGFMHGSIRLGFVAGQTALSFSLAINNAAGILWGSYFLVDNLGIYSIGFMATILGVIVWAIHYFRRGAGDSRISQQAVQLCIWACWFGGIELLFWSLSKNVA